MSVMVALEWKKQGDGDWELVTPTGTLAGCIWLELCGNDGYRATLFGFNRRGSMTLAEALKWMGGKLGVELPEPQP